MTKRKRTKGHTPIYKTLKCALIVGNCKYLKSVLIKYGSAGIFQNVDKNVLYIKMYYFKAKYFCCTLYMYWIKMVLITLNKSLKLADSLSYHLEWYASPSLLTCYSSSDQKRKLYWILLIRNYCKTLNHVICKNTGNKNDGKFRSTTDKIIICLLYRTHYILSSQFASNTLTQYQFGTRILATLWTIQPIVLVI
jgi:hypothetical protein